MSTSDQAKFRAERAVQGAGRIWGRLMYQKRSTPLPHGGGGQRGGRSSTTGVGAWEVGEREQSSEYAARIAARKSTRYQTRNLYKQASGHGLEYGVARGEYENAMMDIGEKRGKAIRKISR